MAYDFLESFQWKISAAAEHLLRQSWTGCAKRKFVSHLFVQWVIFDTSLRLSRPFLDRWNVMIYANSKHDSGTNLSVLNFASQMLNDPVWRREILGMRLEITQFIVPYMMYRTNFCI